MSEAPAVSISDNRPLHRYEARLDGALAGFCEYEPGDGVVTFTHTVVQPEFEGQGVGSALALRVLDDARSRGLKVVPACRFIAAYIARHPQYADLVA
ncbi:GNAT family N-acetyltransferase [Xylophilus rhododendri]|uniref:GNAT family N-acetyltransferase n=1 Tax=Xylophilus rhododendri TaxID=2697032 RepID=A0A857J6G4_9BURK|nr:GNAT family N-acetyltransferase [Xylophilus rhododendri]QHI98611.1 GNAT family N-acetyltransferase [Xylophilus rhododendri]